MSPGRSGTAGAAVAGVLAGATLLLAACTGPAPAAPPAPATVSTPNTAAPNTSAPNTSAASQAVTMCQRYGTARGTLERVLAEIGTGPVLGPGMALLLIVPRDIAATPGVTDPELAAAMAELTAALDDLGAQAEAKLPPGADPLKTTVPVDPTRAMAAVAGADRVCATHR